MPGVIAPRAVATAVAVLAVAGLGLGACADEKPDPAQERLERVETRLRSTFSASQARCILERSDTDVVRALDRTADLPADSPVLAAYSDAVAACVEDPTSTTSTTAEPTTTEATGPDATTGTTAGG